MHRQFIALRRHNISDIQEQHGNQICYERTQSFKIINKPDIL